MQYFCLVYFHQKCGSVEDKNKLMSTKPSKSQGKRLVTIFGGGGYIGPIVARRLLNSGYMVRVVDLFLYGSQNVMLGLMDAPGFEVLNGDHANPNTVKKALMGATDVVILSGLVGDPITKKYPGVHRAVNDVGISRLIDLLDGQKLQRVIFVSTCSNYGFIRENQVADENFELKPLSLYAKAKVKAEKKLLALNGKANYDVVILRFATAFGLAPRMRFDLTISQFVREMALKNKLLVYDPDTWRPYCHVQDFAAVIHNALEAPNRAIKFEVFNAGGEANNYTKRMIVETILKFIPDAPIAYQDHGPDPRNYRVDFTKIRETLNFEPTYTIEDGIQELFSALKENLFPDIEHRLNFYGNYQVKYPVS